MSFGEIKRGYKGLAWKFFFFLPGRITPLYSIAALNCETFLPGDLLFNTIFKIITTVQALCCGLLFIWATDTILRDQEQFECMNSLIY